RAIHVFCPFLTCYLARNPYPNALHKVASVEVLPATASVCSVQASVSVSSSYSKIGNLPFRVDSSLDDDHCNRLLSLLNSFSHIFDSNNSKMGQAVGVEHTINTGDSLPIRQRSYRHSLSERQ